MDVAIDVAKLYTKGKILKLKSTWRYN